MWRPCAAWSLLAALACLLLAPALVVHAAVPAKVTGVSCQAGPLAGGLVVSFNTDDSNGGFPKLFYRVECGGRTLMAQTSPVAFTNVTAPCLVTVTAHNLYGASDSALSEQCRAASIPSPPLAPAGAYNATTGKVSLSWSPAADLGGSLTASYLYRITNASGFEVHARSVIAVSAAVDFPLAVGLYSWTVETVTGAGSSNTTAPAPLDIGSMTVPTPPLIREVVKMNNALQVHFDPPLFNGGSALQSYTLIALSGGATIATQSGVASPLTVTGLSNGASYTLELRATNGVGNSAVTDVASPTGTGPTVVVAPTDLTVLAGGTGSKAVVSWSHVDPASHTFVVSYCAGAGGVMTGMRTVLVNQAPLEITVDGLYAGRYTFSVVAVRSGVWSPPLGPKVLTATGAPPGQISYMEALPFDSGVTLVFGPPSTGEELKSYTVQWQKSVGGFFVGVDAFHSPVTFRGLENGVEHEARIYGSGQPNVGPVRLVSFVPNAPVVLAAPVSVSLSAGAVSSQNATVHFTTNSTLVPTYVTLYDEATDVYRAHAVLDANDTNNRFDLTGLTNGQIYKFFAVARSRGGEIATSDTIDVMPYGIVTPPRNFTCVPGPALLAITCTWAAPAETGGLNLLASNPYELLLDGATWRSVDCAASCIATVGGLAANEVYNLTAKVTASKTPGAGSPEVVLSSDPTDVQSVRPGAVPKAATLQCVDHAPNITVSFSAVQDAGTIPVSYYQLRYSVGGVTTSVNFSVTPTAAVTYTLTGVANGAAHAFQVFVYNSAGVSPASDQTCTAAMAPACVENLAAYSGLQEVGQLHANWTAGPSNGADILAYELSWAPSGAAVGSGSVNVTAPAGAGWGAGLGARSNHTLAGLDPNGLYTVSVRARNRIGLSPLCPAATVLGQAAGPPDAPAIAGVVSSDSALQLSVRAANQTGGVPITSYNCSYTSTAGDGSVNLSSAAASVELHLTGLTNGVTYSLTCVVRNAVGAVSAPSAQAQGVPSAPPQPPQNLTLESGPLSGQINATWLGPASTGGADLTAFNVSWEKVSGGGASWRALALPGPVAPFTMLLTGLEANALYRVTVQAANARGASTALSPSNQQEAFAAGPPGPPTAVVALGQDRALNVSWTAPSSLGGLRAITAYYVSVKHNLTGAVQWRSLAAAAPGGGSLVFDGLVNGEWYVASVVASNGAANSSAAVASPNPAQPRALPGAPRLLGTVAGNSNLTLLLQAPLDLGGLALASFVCLYNDSAPTDPRAAPAPVPSATFPPGGPFVVSGLANGRNYSFVCKATNAVGEGPYSALAFGVPADVPDPPRDLVAVSGPARAQINVSWAPPLWQGGSALTGYVVSWSAVGGTDSGSKEVVVLLLSSVPAPQSLVLDLQANATYAVHVQSRNGVGLSGAATVQALAASEPCPPSSVSASRGNASITVTWGASPCDGGMPLTVYGVRVTVIDDQTGPVANGAQLDFDVAATTGAGTFSLAVDGLSNGFVYSVSVWAANSVGNSSVVSRLVAPATLPSAPVGLGCNTNCLTLPATAGAVSLCWNDPLSDGGDEAVLAYNFTLVHAATGDARVVSCLGNSCPALGLVPRSNYTVTGVAINSVGAGPASAPIVCAAAAVPDVIAPISCTGGNGLVSLSYAAPYSSLPLRYEANHTAVGSGGAPTTVTSSAPLSTISGLANDVSYTITVRACNGVGCGPSSAALTCRPGTAPTVPTNALCWPHNYFINVTLTPPTGGSPATRYSVRRAADAGATVFNSTGATPWVAVTGLTMDTAENLTLWAHNVYGTSPPVSLPPCRTLRLLPPDNLLVFQDKSAAAVAAGAPSCLVYFTPFPQAPGSASFARGFVVEYSKSDQSYAAERRSDAVPVALQGLDPGATYNVRVRASNGYALSEPSASAVCATGGSGYNPDQIPSAPGVAVSPGNGTSTLAVSAPASSGTGGPVRQLWIFTSGRGNSSLGPTPVLVAPSTEPMDALTFAQVSGLVNGLQYYHYVLATQNLAPPSAAGTVPSSLPSAVVFALPQAVYLPPAAPAQASIAISPGDALVRFEVLSPPANPTGSPLLGYVVRWDSGGAQAASNSSSSAAGLPHVLATAQLFNGVATTFTIEAVNGAGSSALLTTPPIVPGLLPSPPQNLVASPRNGSVEVFFQRPADEGTNAVTAFVLYYRDAVHAGLGPLNGTESPIKAAGLENYVGANMTLCSVSAVSNVAPGAVPLWQSAPGSCASFVATPSPTALPSLNGTLIFAMPLGAAGLPSAGVQALDDLCLSRMAYARALVCDPATDRTAHSLLSYRPADAPVFAFNAFLFGGADYSLLAPSVDQLLAGGLRVSAGFAENFTAFFDETTPFGARGGADSLAAHLATGPAFTGCDAHGAHSALGSCQNWTSVLVTDTASAGQAHALSSAMAAAGAWLGSGTGSSCASGDHFLYCAWMPSASDGVQNGDEAGVDCGGTTLFHDGSASFPCVVPPPQIFCPARLEVPTQPAHSYGLMVAPNISVSSLIRYTTALTFVGTGLPAMAGRALEIGGNPWSVRASVVDGKGQTGECTFDVVVVDTEAPALVCIGTQVRAADAGMNYSTGVSWPPPLSVSDNVNVTAVSGPPPASTRFPLGATNVTVSAWDAAGNRGNCTFVVVVGDVEAPVVEYCPAAFVQSTDPGVNYATLAFPQPRARDNVALASELGYLAANSSAGNGTRVYVSAADGMASVNVSWEFADLAGNTARCDFTVTVLDREAPAIACPADVDALTDAGAATAVLALQGAAVSDNVNLTATTTRPQFAVGVSLVQVSAWDERGNEASCSYRVTVADQEPPAIACPPDMSVTLAAGVAVAPVWWAAPNATDNVGVTAVRSNFAPGDMFAVTTVTTVVYAAFDAAGNNATCQFLLRVVSSPNPPAAGSGLGDPAISCPVDLVRVASYASSPPTAVVEWAPPSLTNTKIVASLSGTALPLNSTYFPVGVHTLSYALVDAAGVGVSCSFRVSVLYPTAEPTGAPARAQLSLSNVTTDVVELQRVVMADLAAALEIPATRLSVVAVVAAFNRTDVVIEFAPFAPTFYSQLQQLSASRRLLAVASSSEASELLWLLSSQLSDPSSALLSGPMGSYVVTSTFVNCSDAWSAPWVERATGCSKPNTTSAVIDTSFSCPLGCLPLSQCNSNVGGTVLLDESDESVYKTQWFAIVVTCAAWLALLLLLYLLQLCGCIALTGNVLPARRRHMKEPPTVPWPAVRDTSFRPLAEADLANIGAMPVNDAYAQLRFGAE